MEKDKYYTASKALPEGRTVWAMTFRHPLRRDARGKYGLKVRKGLATTEEDRANDLVEQMNELLSKLELHNISKRADAAKLFDEIIVSAFYDGVEPEGYNPELIRTLLFLFLLAARISARFVSRNHWCRKKPRFCGTSSALIPKMTDSLRLLLQKQQSRILRL